MSQATAEHWRTDDSPTRPEWSDGRNVGNVGPKRCSQYAHTATFARDTRPMKQNNHAAYLRIVRGQVTTTNALRSTVAGTYVCTW